MGFRTENANDAVCAICQTQGNYKVIYPANITSEDISTTVFSARRIPDRKTHQWVKCNTCALFRADPRLSIVYSEIYEHSKFDYTQELPGLAATYKKLISRAAKKLRKEDSAILEIGGGNGFALEASAG